MRPNDLDRKNVISKEGRQLGHVIDIEIDASTWKVTHLRLGLVDKMLQPFGLTIEKKPGEKYVDILLPTETVEILSDFVILNKTIDELKELIGRPNVQKI